jgi:hypothetical protein
MAEFPRFSWYKVRLGRDRVRHAWAEGRMVDNRTAMATAGDCRVTCTRPHPPFRASRCGMVKGVIRADDVGTNGGTDAGAALKRSC